MPCAHSIVKLSVPMPTPNERQAFGLRIPKPSHPELRKLHSRHTPTAQGHKTWNATWLLADFLTRQDLPRGLRVIDVGCGWGLAGIFCARAFAAQVTSVDIDSQVFPFLQLHARLNEVEVQTLESPLDEIPANLLAEQDLLVGVDICFREKMVAPVHSLVERALAVGVPRLLLADPSRPSFKNLCTLCAAHSNTHSQSWQIPEPLIDWPGRRPSIEGQLLICGDFSPSPA